MDCFSKNCTHRAVYVCDGKQCVCHGCDTHIRPYVVHDPHRGTRRFMLCTQCALMIALLATVEPDPYH